MLIVEESRAGRIVVKDYGTRPAAVRHLLVPLLLRHELGMLERLEGLPGIPRQRGRIGRWALAMEHVDGEPLERRIHRGRLPPAFFDALEGILAGLEQRGVIHLDLRSPTNVLCTADGAPALVDMASVWPWPLPGALRERLERSALRKLRSRFEGEPGIAVRIMPDDALNLKAGGCRFRLVDQGALDDPVPALLLHDVGLSSAQFRGLVESAPSVGRRALAVDLPGFGRSARPRWRLGPDATAARLRTLLDALRLPRVDVVGDRWGGLVGRLLALRDPSRVRCLLTLDSPLEVLSDDSLACWRAAARGAAALRERVEARIARDLPRDLEARLLDDLARCSGRALLAAYRKIAVSPALGSSDEKELPLRAGIPSQPWLFVTSTRADETAPRPHVRHPTVQGARWAPPLDDPARLWAHLRELARGA